ncbi:MAG: phytanoyl-CoA dioxygenase family protein [Bacteroidia bacterium]
MFDSHFCKTLKELSHSGIAIVENVYTEKEVEEIIQLIDSKGIGEQFGVRAFLSVYPDIAQKVFTQKLIALVKTISPTCNKSIKSIYFNKPQNANWVVNWHQDLTINLTDKKETPNFKNWRVLADRTVVQPSTEMLENIFTIRIHLDDCTAQNGALRVIEKSHNRGVVDTRQWQKKKNEQERICEVKKGGVLLMKPLTLHSSKRTENEQNRRVIHIEFTDSKLPDGLQWKEKMELIKHTQSQLNQN